jgi:hypothetical protein
VAGLRLTETADPQTWERDTSEGMGMVSNHPRIRGGVNGHGVIGQRVAAAVNRQDDMLLVGVSDANERDTRG